MPESRSLVSIPLCTYNGATFLREQLNSLLQQTYADIEIIAVDDGSTDATVVLLLEYARRDSRVRVHVNPQNLGYRRNFEHALQLCGGDYIAPCDQDDVWLSGKLQRLLLHLGNRMLIYCDSELVDADGRSLGTKMSDKWPMRDLDTPVSFVFGNCVSGHAMLFRRELLQQALPIPSAFFHDWWLAAVAAASKGVSYWPEALVLYRQHGNNVTDVLQQRASQHAETGTGVDKLRAVRERIVALARLSGEHQPYLQCLLELWDARFDRWLSIGLSMHMLREAEALFSLTRRTSWQRRLAPWKYLPGLRLKRLIGGVKYRDAV